MNTLSRSKQLISYGVLSALVVMGSGCSSNGDDNPATDETADMDGTSTAGEATNTDGTSTAGETVNTDGTSTAGESPNIDENTITDDVTIPVFSCEERASMFVTKGSANADLPDPQVSALCVDDMVVVNSNQIPDFPYIETSPGNPQEYALEFQIPATPTVAAAASDVPALGALGVAINGIPIYGATEGTGGDVLSLGGGFTECGGHNGPTGYHYHTFDVDGSDYCLFSEAEATAAPQLFGYALDGYPIYSGNFQYTSSWYLSDPSLFATDTFSAHTFVEGSGDLDQCNGRTDANGNYAYYTTDSFPYTLGCYRGVVAETVGGGGGGGPRR